MGFLCWKDHVATIIRHERIVNRALKTMQNRSLSRSFRQWVSMLESARQERAAAAAASLLAEKEAMRAAHEAELAASKAAAEKARRETTFRRVVLRAVNVRLSMGFLCWKDHVATIIRHERIVNRALKTMQNRSLSRSFRQWVSMLESARQERAAAAAASLLAEKEAMRAAHEAELAASKAAAEKARRETTFRRVVLRAVNVRLSMGFLCWKDHVATIIRHERIVNRALKTMQNRSLSRSFRQWVSMLESARQERAAAAKEALIGSGLSEVDALKMIHDSEIQRLNSELFTRFEASKAAAEKARRETTFRRVVLRAVNVRLSMGFLCWKDHVATIIRHERIVNRALKTMQNRSLSRSFRQWVSMLESARQERAAAAAASLLAEKEAMRAAHEAELAASKAAAEKARRETTFRRVVLRAVNVRLSMGFLCWKDHVATIIRHERIVNRALKTMQNRSLSRSFRQWVSMLESARQERAAAAAASLLAEKEAMRAAHEAELAASKAAAEKARRETTFRRVVLRAVNVRLSMGFLCWKDHVATIIRHERIVNRALKTMQNRSLSRSFRQWVSMLESARQERAAAAAASLLAEKEAMRAAHEAELAASKAAAEKARRETTFRRVVLRAVNVRLSMGFLCWKDHVATIIRHERIVNRALKTMQNRSLSRSFRQWVSMLESARQERAAAAAASLLAEKEAMRAAHEAELAASKAAAEKARRETTFRRVVLRAVNVRLSMGFLCWKDHVATIIRHERIVNRALKTMQNRSLSRSFRQWVSMLESARQERAAAAAASLLAEKEAMRAAHEAELAASKAAAEKARREINLPSCCLTSSECETIDGLSLLEGSCRNHNST
jgi:hypothetical protein